MENGGTIRVQGCGGEEVIWSRKSVGRAVTLSNMIDDSLTEGVLPMQMITAPTLARIGTLCEDDDVAPALLEQLSITELTGLIEGAIILEAPCALECAQCVLAARLAGKRAHELRELLGTMDDFESDEERAAALTEPAFTPDGQGVHPTTASGSAGPPDFRPQPLSSELPVPDDAKWEALGKVDVRTLVELKGVNQSWRALARCMLCSRLCWREGAGTPSRLEDITDVNVQLLIESGRLWEVALVGKLPSLAKLRGYGFVVDVAAVRSVPLQLQFEVATREEGLLCAAVQAALRLCCTGEGEPPIALLLAAIACASSGHCGGIPVENMRVDGYVELNLRGKGIHSGGAKLIACLVPAMTSLTSVR